MAPEAGRAGTPPTQYSEDKSLEMVRRIHPFVPKLSGPEWNGPETLLAVCLTLCALILSTRILSGRRKSQTVRDDGLAQSVPLLPYWLPAIGSYLRFAYSPEKLLEDAK